MAHIGNLYKVLSRRDYNLNIATNRVGYANRYFVRLSTTVQGIGGVLAGTEWTTDPARLSIRDTMIWQTAFERIVGLDWRVQLESIINADFTYTQLGQVALAGVGVVTEWDCTSDLPRRPFFPTVGNHTIYYDPDVFASDPKLWQSFTRPWFWADGPPQ